MGDALWTEPWSSTRIFSENNCFCASGSTCGMARLRKKLSGDGGPLSSAAAAGETWSVRSGWMDEWMDEPCAGKLVVDIHYMYVHRANHAEREGEDGPHSVQPTEVPMN